MLLAHPASALVEEAVVVVVAKVFVVGVSKVVVMVTVKVVVSAVAEVVVELVSVVMVGHRGSLLLPATTSGLKSAPDGNWGKVKPP